MELSRSSKKASKGKGVLGYEVKVPKDLPEEAEADPTWVLELLVLEKRASQLAIEGHHTKWHHTMVKCITLQHLPLSRPSKNSCSEHGSLTSSLVDVYKPLWLLTKSCVEGNSGEPTQIRQNKTSLPDTIFTLEGQFHEEIVISG